MNPQSSLNSVQVGCGLRARDGWLNFDKSPSLLLSKIPLVNKMLKLPAWTPNAKYGCIVNGLGLPDGSCCRIYADQVFEHLTLEGFRNALKNAHKLLVPGGVIRFFIPHLKEMIEEYQANADSQASHLLMLRLGMGVEHESRGLEGLLRNLFGNSRHRWIWDEKSLRDELSRAGFTDIKVVKYGDSGDEMFDRIELPVPWDFSLGVQASRAQ
jgi:SAM-dependent methyltransferase